jgi:hypothetical protein
LKLNSDDNPGETAQHLLMIEFSAMKYNFTGGVLDGFKQKKDKKF